MVVYFVERHGGVKGDEQDHVAIRVERKPICGDVGAVSGRSVAMCGDPQATITNRCDFKQCKSGKNRLFCSEDREQVACVSVHCKLVTRATQFVAYRQRRGGVKGSLFSVSDQMRRTELSGVNDEGSCFSGHQFEYFEGHEVGGASFDRAGDAVRVARMPGAEVWL
tara:strand:+ start:79 stop:576 length:498 start_codon:yes stop_codon:yes gene_type:complete